MAERAREITIEELKALLSYDAETGVFRWLVSRGRKAKKGDIAGNLDSSGHRQIMIHGRGYGAHRLAWFFCTGEWPTHQIDHKDRDRDNNRFANLRPASHAENRQNADSPVGRSGLPGATYHKGSKKWCSAIRANGVRVHLGMFSTAEAAHAAYRAASLEIHGEFSRFAK